MPIRIPKSTTASCSLTVYSDGFALVKDTRSIPQVQKDDWVHFIGVSKRLDQDSVIVEGADVSELIYEYDLMDELRIYERYLGRQLIMKDPFSKGDRKYTLLRANGPVVMQDVETNELIINPRGEIRFPEIEGGNHIEPTLVWQVKEQRSEEVCVSYLTGGVSWKADYVISLHGDQFDLSGWLTMKNYSGVSFNDAKLRLISGKLSKAGNETEEKSKELSKNEKPKADAFSDFHTYSYPRPIDLEDRQQKQLRLLSSTKSQARMVYEINEQTSNPDIFIEFDNTVENGLGFPLPTGVFKMYRTSSQDGSAEFIGEYRIKHTEVGEKVRLKSGEACDIKVNSKKSGKYKEGGYEYTEYEYTICNTKEVPVEAVIRQQIPGHLWTVDESTHEWNKKRDKILLPVHVPVNKEETVKFTIRHDRSARRTIGF
ncbi:DUF4139 domain-containing protein [Sporosarcina highlanderae]|uniref:DUF4139 domain-containing protein n=1 Tax=Sporosarcina highlanderae TaxID=3035916 RepID=A0ABT8JM28_9BACL|nr:DUF4139 domain-containing protein [Sporosarcina highlanderae]MDN4606200.1 DUF4139 domain-containing protein [Sporosarcina highlanderae]